MLLLDLMKNRVLRENDVEDVLALELEEKVDDPGTAIGTSFSVLHWIFCPVFQRSVAFDHWPHTYEYP